MAVRIQTSHLIAAWFLSWNHIPMLRSAICAQLSVKTQENKHILMVLEWYTIGTLLLLLCHFSRVWLCDPIDGSPPGSPIPGILQARTLEWVAISFFNVWNWKVKVKSLSRVRLFATPRTAAHQAPPSMGFSRQEYWSGSPLPSPTNTLPCVK